MKLRPWRQKLVRCAWEAAPEKQRVSQHVVFTATPVATGRPLQAAIAAKMRMKTRDASSARQALQRENALIINGDGVQPLILIFGCGGELLGVQAQKFHNLGFYLVAQVDVLVQQGAHFFTALAQFFGAKGEP